MMVEHSKSKSTQPRSARRCLTANPVQRLAKKFVGGWEKFLPALAKLLCLALPWSCLAKFAYVLAGLCTEMRFILCTWFGEVCSCSCLNVLPGPAWVLLSKICKD